MVRRTEQTTTLNRKQSQADYDLMLRDWPGSREPTDEQGVDLPVGNPIPVDWTHWRVRSYRDLVPVTYNDTGCRWELDTLEGLSIEVRLAVDKARKQCLKLARQVKHSSHLFL
jgi:hypothetical protein